ncbi:MAG: GyrI-like domain-containing protein [Anaerolineae bacterium]
MTKIDLKKELKQLYNPSKTEISVVEVPVMNFLMVDGRGDPNTSLDYQAAIETLFSLSYTLKFMLKKAGGDDYAVMPLEGLWWADDVHQPDLFSNKDAWYWTAMMMQPPLITREMVKVATDDVRRKKAPAALDKVRFERFAEGWAAQIMYICPFADERPTIDRIHAHIEESGYKLTGKHHEIYLSDFRRAAPEKLKTVIRQPFRKS